MRSFATAVAALAAVLLLPGCSVVDGLSGKAASPAEERACTTEFHIAGNASSLGSGVRFQYALEDAVKGTRPTTPNQLAQTAGWTGTWDRVVDLSPGITAEDLERITGITGMCWKSLPEKDLGSEQQYGYYLFLDGDVPVQTLPWTSDIKYLEFGDAGVVGRDDELIPTQGRVTGGRVLAPAE
ncbi:hypothetical protein ACIG56_16045 [Nocardia fusca]|uniref:hypothetical protein n=1 Tax=Nocardia fusca TaxID=941183 RepID=UPI0037C5269C